MITPVKFKEDVLTLAKKVDVEPKEIHLREMKNKWGSCSTKGRLTFDKKLLEESEEIRFKVILHELIHLRYPNHGKMFKSMLKAYLRNIDISNEREGKKDSLIK